VSSSLGGEVSVSSSLGGEVSVSSSLGGEVSVSSSLTMNFDGYFSRRICNQNLLGYFDFSAYHSHINSTLHEGQT
jgi:hypothetical protein